MEGSQLPWQRLCGGPEAFVASSGLADFNLVSVLVPLLHRARDISQAEDSIVFLHMCLLRTYSGPGLGH